MSTTVQQLLFIWTIQSSLLSSCNWLVCVFVIVICLIVEEVYQSSFRKERMNNLDMRESSDEETSEAFQGSKRKKNAGREKQKKTRTFASEGTSGENSSSNGFNNSETSSVEEMTFNTLQENPLNNDLDAPVRLNLPFDESTFSIASDSSDEDILIIGEVRPTVQNNSSSDLSQIPFVNIGDLQRNLISLHDLLESVPLVDSSDSDSEINSWIYRHASTLIISDSETSVEVIEDQVNNSLETINNAKHVKKRFSTVQCFWNKHTQKISLDKNCTICQNIIDQGEEVVILRCCDSFHVECFEEYIKRRIYEFLNEICPNCKSQIVF